MMLRLGPMEPLRAIAPPLLAVASVWLIDQSTQRRGLMPPQFRLPTDTDLGAVWLAWGRRALSLVVLGLVLWIGVFLPLSFWGLEQEIDFSLLSGFDLFTLHLMLVFCVAVWYLLGFVPARPDAGGKGTTWSAQLGFRAESIQREIGIGLLAGVAAWLFVIGTLLAVALAIWWLGGEELLPREPPKMIPWIAGMPVALRVAISLSAGLVEEMFFRGYLQPRIGLAFSSGLFILAHASYEQPMMLLGVGLLSVIYGLLVRWRQNIWPAIAAHAVFDAIQLLLVIPAALKVLPEETQKVLAVAVFGLF